MKQGEIALPLTADERPATAKRKLSRLDDVDRGKGLAIALVVIGHAVTQPPAGAEWYAIIAKAIYQFHMAYFMFLCGFVFAYQFEPVRRANQWAPFVTKRAVRLLVPFVVLGLLILALKVSMSASFMIADVPASFADGLRDLYVHTRKSPAQFTWFILCLFFYQMIAQLLLSRGANLTYIIVLVGVVLYFTPAPDFMYLHLFTEFLLYFGLGLVAGARIQSCNAIVDRGRWIFVIAFLAALVLQAVWAEFPHAKLICGLLSIPALAGLARQPLERQEWLARLGRFSYPIYLFNSLAIGTATALLLIAFEWNVANFAWILPTLIGVGLFVPIVLRQLIFRRIPLLNEMTR